MIKNILRNESAVSPVLGAILILAIGVTLLSTVQLNFVPVWNTQEELDHLKVMVDDFKVLKSGIESGIQSGTASSLPLSMGFKYSPKVLVYNPKESAYASLDIQENTWAEVRYNEIFPDGITDDTSIKNVTTSTITYALKGASNYNAFFYEHGLIRRKGSDYTTNSQIILANNTIDLLSVKPLGSETRSSVEKKTVNIYPTSQQKNSVIGKNVWLILHTKPEYVNWWKSILGKEGGLVRMGNNGIVITYIDSAVIKMGEVYISTASRAAPAHAPPFRIIKISQDNTFLPVEGTSNLIVEVQDKYNNPVPNVQVNYNINKTRPPGNANTGTLIQNSAISGADGRANVMLRTNGSGFYYIEASTSDGITDMFAFPASSQGGVLGLTKTGSEPLYDITATLTDGLGTPANGKQIIYDASDGDLSVTDGQTDVVGRNSSTLNVSNANGIKNTNINSNSTTYNSTIITWNTVNNITVTARSGYIFNSIIVPTNVITSGCVQYGTVSGGPYPNIRCDLMPPSSSHSVSLTGLEANTAYYFKVNSSNGTRSVTSTEYMFVTGQPVTMPASVTNISYTSGPLYIKWTWEEPAGVDHVELYVDNPPAMVVSGQQYFNASYFRPNSTHTIYIRTVDIDGQANTTWMNLTAYTPSVFDYVFNLSSITFGTVNNFNNAKSDSDSGASAQFYEINTPAVPDSYNDTSVTVNNDTLGTTTSFASMQSASDGGAYATLSESAVISSDILISPSKSITNGTQSGTYTATDLNTADGSVDITIPNNLVGLNGWTFPSDAQSWTAAGTCSGASCTLTSGWNNADGIAAGSIWYKQASTTTADRTTPSSRQSPTFAWTNGTPNTAYVNFSYKVLLTGSLSSVTITAKIIKPDATKSTIYTGSAITSNSAWTNISVKVGTANFSQSGNYRLWLNGSLFTTNNPASAEVRWDNAYVNLSSNYSTDVTYSYTVTAPSSSWQNITITDSSYGATGTNAFIYNQATTAWDSLGASAFSGGTSASQHINTVLSTTPSNYDTGGGIIKFKYQGNDLTTNGNIGVDLLKPQVYYNNYGMNITTDINSIAYDTQYTLQTSYRLGNTNEAQYNMDIWNFASSTWGNTQSLTSTSWIQNNVTLASDQISGGQVKTRFTDQTPTGTAPGDLFIDFQRIHGFTAGTSAGYHLDITTDTTDIPEANTLPVLQLKYTVSGGNFTVLIKNGTTSGWDSATTLNATGMPYRNITLTQDELLLYGTFSGNMPPINKYYVQVRYQDESPLLNGTLNLDYQRVYSS